MISSGQIGSNSLLAKNPDTPMYIAGNSIVLDLQKEIAEDKELLDLIIEPQKPKGIDSKHESFKALFQRNRVNIEMIPEEDEEKQKSRSKIIFKEKDINQIINKQLTDSRFKSSKRNLRQKQLESLTNNNNNNNNNNINDNNKINKETQTCAEQLIQSKLNQENEKKEIEMLLSHTNRNKTKGIPLITEKIPKLASLGDTFDFLKRQSIIYYI